MNEDLFQSMLPAVEQQLQSPQTSYVKATYDRLVSLGVENEEAKLQIAYCLAEATDRMLRSKGPFEEGFYRDLLNGLPLENDEEE